MCSNFSQTNCTNANEVSRNLSATVQNGSVITTQHDVTHISNIITDIVEGIEAVKPAEAPQVCIYVIVHRVKI